MMVVDAEFQQGFPDQTNLFDRIMALEGKIYREMDGRRTLQFSHAGKSYFVKLHFGVGWKEIIKNLMQLKIPVVGAANEWKAIQKLNALDIDTMHLVGYGSKGLNPATRQSFVITEDLGNTLSLEDYCAPWKTQAPLSGKALTIKRRLIQRLASVGKTLHNHGINHRDFYLVHFLLDMTVSEAELATGNITASLIDLHRVQIRLHTPQRWRTKDIGALYFASLEIGLTKRDIFRFMRNYQDKSLRQTLTQDKVFWQAVQDRAIKLYNKLYHRDPEFPLRVGLAEQ